MSVNVSVIIPVYKVERYLAACLDSVLSQDFGSFEVIAVNDGSPDACGEMLAGYTDPRLRVITQENKGLGAARNTGIAAARGEYLLFVDSDDALLPGALSTLYGHAVETGADMVCFGMEYVNEAGQLLSTHRATEAGRQTLAPADYLVEYAADSYAWNKLYRAALFTQTGIRFPARVWYEDLATVPKAILASRSVVLTDGVFYRYLQRGDSIMHQANVARTAEMLEAVEGVLTHFREQGAWEAYRTQLEYLTVLHVLVLATQRVVAANRRHPLLREFYRFVAERFPDFCRNPLLSRLPLRRRVMYELSRRRRYGALWLLSKLNEWRG